MSESHNKVPLIFNGQYDEANASGVCKPGHLLTKDANGKVSVLATASAPAEIMVAIEDGLQGYPPREIWDEYAVDDLVPYVRPKVGDVMNLRVAAGAAAIAKHAYVMPAADGTVVLHTGTNFRLGRAEEAIDNSGGSEEAIFAVRIVGN